MAEGALELVVKLFNELLALTGKIKERRLTIFKQNVEPLFAALEPVAHAYYKMLRDARDAFTANPHALRNILTEIERNREDMVLTRNKVLGKAEVAYSWRLGRHAVSEKQNDVDASIRELGGAIIRYFRASDEGRHSTLASSLTAEIRTSIEFIKESSPEPNVDRYEIAAADLKDEFDAALRHLERRWQDVASAYEQVKANCSV